ncbi:hypothetical protein GCM10020220_113500 [Nonomuraea rubra]
MRRRRGLACGATYALVTGLTGLHPEWREMDRGRGRPGRGQRVIRPWARSAAVASGARRPGGP